MNFFTLELTVFHRVMNIFILWLKTFEYLFFISRVHVVEMTYEFPPFFIIVFNSIFYLATFCKVI